MQANRWTLYVAGDGPRSVAAQIGVTRLRSQRGLTPDQLDVVDVLADPDRARGDGVLVTPCLVAGDPSTGPRVFGDLDDPHKLLWSLGLSERNPS